MPNADQDVQVEQLDPAQPLLDLIAAIGETLSQADRAKYDELIAQARGESGVSNG